MKKIIFFPIVQITLNVGMLVYRFKDYIIAFKGIDYLARLAATLSSVSSISYTLIFAITNKIFTHSEEERETESEIETETERETENEDSRKSRELELEKNKIYIN